MNTISYVHIVDYNSILMQLQLQTNMYINQWSYIGAETPPPPATLVTSISMLCDDRTVVQWLTVT